MVLSNPSSWLLVKLPNVLLVMLSLMLNPLVVTVSQLFTRPTSCKIINQKKKKKRMQKMWRPVVVFRKLADGLFLEVCKQVSKEFPNIKFDDVLLDRACLHVSRIKKKSCKQVYSFILDYLWSFHLCWHCHGHAQLVWWYLVWHECWFDRWSWFDSFR